jgi:hypothetical protein
MKPYRGPPRSDTSDSSNGYDVEASLIHSVRTLPQYSFTRYYTLLYYRLLLFIVTHFSSMPLLLRWRLLEGISPTVLCNVNEFIDYHNEKRYREVS